MKETLLNKEEMEKVYRDVLFGTVEERTAAIARIEKELSVRDAWIAYIEARLNKEGAR